MIMAKDDYLILEMLRFGHEVLDVNEVHYLDSIEKPRFNAKELKMAEELIDGMTAEWDPEKYKDTYNSDVMKIINTKVKAGEGQDIQWELPKEEKGNTGKVVDLMPLLKKSLEQKRKAAPSRKKTARRKAG